MKILVIEDEKLLADSLKTLLEGKGFQVEVAYDGETGEEYAELGIYDLLILDVMMPGMDGYQVARKVRAKRITTSILMLTARSDVEDRIQGLKAGADYYLTKPFDPEELLARVGAMTRRRGTMVLNELSFQDLTLDLNTVTLRCGARDVQLSPKEFALARLLLSQPSMTYSKDLLISRAWGLDSEATDNNVEAYISFLRKKLRYLGSRVTIKNLQKIGYRLEVAP